ncbi:MULTISPECIES: hypothetical protein [unclassified Leucobacter]|uniref:hypothetical protein n=1 Tax=unclassified Leucobacter TaxID=2621730 RepID=UPI000621AC48|nr:hypothetical protein [Leucobacter sp. Ag1]KKI16421.1 hypothetical protein XM48_16690 [Leucobacter sp. Ag1]
MDPNADRPPRRLFIAAAAGATVLLLLIGVGVYGLLRGPASADTPHTPASPTSPAEETRQPSFTPRAVTETAEAEAFARSVAERLFGWDTGLEYGPADYMQRLVDVADPAEAPGLAADVRGYFPEARAWGELRQYQTRQWIEIDSIVVPSDWAAAKAQAGAGQLPPGAIAYTITGTRHRTGMWDGRETSDACPISFTIFAACTSGDGCRLLRLSAVNQPLN